MTPTVSEIFPDSPPASLASGASPSWRKAGLRYHSYRYFLRQKFDARRVQKVSLDAGFTCPNVDGTVATGGCTFCDTRSFSPSRRNRLTGSNRREIQQRIHDQLEDGIRRLKHRYEVDDFIA